MSTDKTDTEQADTELAALRKHNVDLLSELKSAKADRAVEPEILSDYCTREQLAEELKITVRTLDKWAVQRSGPPKIKIGARCYYKRSSVLAWIDSKSDAHTTIAY